MGVSILYHSRYDFSVDITARKIICFTSFGIFGFDYDEKSRIRKNTAEYTKNAVSTETAKKYVVFSISLRSLNKTRTQAARTNVYSAWSTIHYSLDSLYIGLKGSVAASMGVRNLDTEGNALSAYFTFCHIFTPSFRKY